MCFGGGGNDSTPQVAAPSAPAPAPAEPAPTETEVNSARRQNTQQTFGSSGPTTRVDRSVQGGTSGGSGLTM